MSQLSLESADGVAIVRFGNPPKGLMNQQTVNELRELAGRLTDDATIGAVIFTGGLDGVFIRHYDTGELSAAGQAISRMKFSGAAGQFFPERDVDVAFQMIENLPQVTIAAINGYCMGGGYEFALCCDLRIAQHGDYLIGLPETKGGIFPGAGGTQRLPRVVGMAKALDFILRGRLVTPAEAERHGLVHELAVDALAEARDIASRMANRPAGQQGMRLAKRLVRQALARPLHEGIAHERTLIAELMASPAVFQFLERASNEEFDITKMK
ncbi:MAG: enoyl-CoA hydratase/isomerase family protein [Hyphomonadaceae bacterium]|nr:enoyl-CoA hydratase/isomerase family protein [Hyphomonadaceae bacterium]